MREPYDIIIAPVVTEKSADQMENNTYSFVVAPDANKIEIGHAVEKLWDVTVKDVRTMRYAGKAKRAFMGRMSRGAGMGRRPSWKKAVVQLSEGDYIEPPLTLKAGVNILGGVDSDFVFTGTRANVTIESTTTMDRLIGVNAEGIEEATYLGYLSITTQDVPVRGTNYGVRVYQSPALTLSNLTVTSGAGGAGENGAPA